MTSILILSPHPDDAALSCADHISHWKKKSYDITVCTVFTKYSSKSLSDDAKKFMNRSGFDNQNRFEVARNSEDRGALLYLAVKNIRLKYIDAAFRSYRKVPIYKNFNKLFKGNISSQDKKIINELKNYYYLISKKYDYIVLPIGIGNHIDHRILRDCANVAIPQKKLLYYFDSPYDLRISNWSWKYLIDFWSSYKSILFTSQLKRTIIHSYISQRYFFFQGYKSILLNNYIMMFPEIIISKSNKISI